MPTTVASGNSLLLRRITVQHSISLTPRLTYRIFTEGRLVPARYRSIGPTRRDGSSVSYEPEGLPLTLLPWPCRETRNTGGIPKAPWITGLNRQRYCTISRGKPPACGWLPFFRQAEARYPQGG